MNAKARDIGNTFNVSVGGVVYWGILEIFIKIQREREVLFEFIELQRAIF